MIIKEVKAKSMKDSRRERTIQVSINGYKTSAPSGKSKGKYEARPYNGSLIHDIKFINNLGKKNKIIKFPEIKKFEDLKKIEKIVKTTVGANSLFAFEASVLKALAKSEKKELFQLLNQEDLKLEIPLLISNTVGGGAHSHNWPKPDFQEFLVIGNKKQNLKVYKKAKKLVKANGRNDEHAWNTSLCDEEVMSNLRSLHMGIGVDMASSEFFRNKKYRYHNIEEDWNTKEQIAYVKWLVDTYDLIYVEDGLNEEDFLGFAQLNKEIGKKCLIVGDDLTTTNLSRVKKAIKMKSINGLIVKPNQIGSLIEVKKVIDLCKENKIKTIMSHRSGETLDNTIADLAVAWQCDFMKISVVGKERLAKVKRLEKIKRMLKRSDKK